MNKIHDCEKEVKISFPNRTKLIQFVSRYLAYMYKKEIDYWRLHFIDAPMDAFMMELSIRMQAPKFQRNMKKLLKGVLQHKSNIKITSNGCIMKRAFEMSGIETSPTFSFAGDIEYEIRDLVFITKYK